MHYDVYVLKYIKTYANDNLKNTPQILQSEGDFTSMARNDRKKQGLQ